MFPDKLPEGPLIHLQNVACKKMHDAQHSPRASRSATFL